MEGALWTIDWAGMFTPTRSVLEMVVRATIMYFVIVLLLKVVVKRQTGGVGSTDLTDRARRVDHRGRLSDRSP